MILLLLKFKDNKLFPQRISNIPILNQNQKKRLENYKVQKSKIWGISRQSVCPLSYVGSLVSFFIYGNPLHVNLQTFLVPQSWMKELRKTNAIGHPPLRPRLTDPAQDLISKFQGIEGTIITKSPLTVTKLPCNATCRVVRATAMPNQRNIVILKAVVDHG